MDRKAKGSNSSGSLLGLKAKVKGSFKRHTHQNSSHDEAVPLNAPYLGKVAQPVEQEHSEDIPHHPDFDGFLQSRFLTLQTDGPPETTVSNWFMQLPSSDPKHRFTPESIQYASSSASSEVSRRLQRESKLQSVFAQTDGPVDQFLWALLLHSIELYHIDAHTKRQVKCQYQLYIEFSKACRMYGHTGNLTAEEAMEWKLFKPFAQWLDGAIQALPKANAVLYGGLAPTDVCGKYPTGAAGAWGGYLSPTGGRWKATSDRLHSTFRNSHSGTVFFILSDEARCLKPMLPSVTEQHLHPLAFQFEVCDILPSTLLLQLGLRVNIVTLKQAGSKLSFALRERAFEALRSVYSAALSCHIPSRVKEDTHDAPSFKMVDKINEFLQCKTTNILLLLTPPAGAGKTMSALWLTSRVSWGGWLWLYLSVHHIKDLFSEGALVRLLVSSYGLEQSRTTVLELCARPIVLVIDGLDEVTPPVPPPRNSWWDLNGFKKWKIKLVVTCGHDRIQPYNRCFGNSLQTLYLQGFDKAEQQLYITHRILIARACKFPMTQADPPSNGSQSSAVAALAAASGAVVLVFLADLQASKVMTHLNQSRLASTYSDPFKLRMAVDLALALGALDIQQGTALYTEWLMLEIARASRSAHRSANLLDAEKGIKKAEKLAWRMCVKGLTYDAVGKNGKKDWFMCLPLCLNNYDPASLFRFPHHSMHNYLAAAFLFWKLREGAMSEKDMGAVDLTHNHQVLRFFGDLCCGDDAIAFISQQLFSFVFASCDDLRLGRCAANSITLLNACQVSFKGIDLSGIHAPGANLQGANLCHVDFRRACLSGADLRGATMDGADFRSADLTGAIAGHLLHCLDGHQDSVSCVVIVAAGSRLVSGSQDTTVGIWDQERGALLCRLKGHMAAVNSVAVAADGIIAVSGSDDTTVRTWDLQNYKPLNILTGHSHPVNSVAITPDTTIIASASDDGTVRIWERLPGTLLRTLEGHTKAVNAVALPPNASLIVSGSSDTTLRIWSRQTGKVMNLLKGHTDTVTSVAIAADGNLVVSGSADKTIRVWDRQSGSVLHVLERHTGTVSSVAVSLQRNFLVSGSHDKSIRTWNPLTGKLLSTLEGHSCPVSSVAVSAYGDVIASASREKAMLLWDSAPGEPLHKKEGHCLPVRCVAASPSSDFIITGCDDSVLRVWHQLTGELLAKLEGHRAPVYCVSVSPDGSFVVSGSADSTLRVWKRPTGLLHALEGHQRPVTGVAISSDCKLIISASEDETVRIWDQLTGKLLKTLTGHKRAVRGVTITPDCSRIMSVSDDQTLLVWDRSTGEICKTFTGHLGSVRSVAIFPDNEHIASGAEDWSVRVWNLATGTQTKKLQGHTAEVSSVVVSPDGTFIASASNDCTVCLWNWHKGELLATLEGHTAPVTCVVFSRKGSHVISTSMSRTVRIWACPSGNQGLSNGDSPPSRKRPADSGNPARAPELQCLIKEVSGQYMHTNAKGALYSRGTKMTRSLGLLLQQYGAVARESADGQPEYPSGGRDYVVFEGLEMLTDMQAPTPTTTPIRDTRLRNFQAPMRQCLSDDKTVW